jgi:hypothetical protein
MLRDMERCDLLFPHEEEGANDCRAGIILFNKTLVYFSKCIRDENFKVLIRRRYKAGALS